jgi:hypothetical protein
MDSDAFRALTRVKQSKLGIATPAGDDMLAVELDRAAAYVEFVTGQPAMDSDTTPFATAIGTVSAASLPVLMKQAIQMRTEQVTFQSQAGYLDDATDDVTSSISVGGFSQSKRDTARKGEEKQLNSWQALSNLLWLLMTPDRFAWWTIFLSNDPEMIIGPAWGVEQTWQQSAGPEGGWGFGFGFGGGAYGMADYAFSGWQGGMGGLPPDLFPLMTD